MSFLSQLEWRHATKSFDESRPISSEQLDKVLEATRMAPTSFGLQPFRVYVISDTATKQKLCEAGWNQKQFLTATYILAFTNEAHVEKRIQDLLNLMSQGNAQARAKLAGYESMMQGFLSKRSPQELKAWADKQAYIALGFAMAACAELEIDSCPMEGFSGPEVDAILKVPPGEHVSVMLTLGYRDPQQALRPKFRFPETALFRKV